MGRTKTKQRPITTWAREKPILTPDRVALLLGITETQVRVLARAGELPGFKLGKLWRFEKTALMRFAGVQVGGNND